MRLVKQLMVIINPHSGTLSKDGMDQAIRHEAAKYSLFTDIRFTGAPGDATILAQEAIEKGYYGVLACGGDGTVNETARALCGSEVALGIIPMGSGNGLARHLYIPLTIKGAMKVIAEDRVISCDYASANGQPFFCTFGVGFDAEVTYKFNSSEKRGLATYIQTTLDEFIKYRPEEYTIISNNQTISENALLIACCNASQYGNNAYIAPEASIKDGLLDITIIHKGSPVKLALAGLDILTGLVGKTAHATTFRTTDLIIRRKKAGPAHIDGEPADMTEEIEIKCHPGQLKIFTNGRKSQYRAFRSPQIPFISPFLLTMQDIGYRIARVLKI
ncbi:MAG: diacylglycerol kinase family lipid kinase [Muribaculaceae bacterium]|nr:diacylglycerol kinase family lipid kinase [Muribaculaceae bacterium]